MLKNSLKENIKMSNHHNHKNFREENLIIIIIILNFIITLVEVIGGLLSGSLSLLSDGTS